MSDIRWSRADACTDERAYWHNLIADDDPERLALGVLGRLRLDSEDVLLDIEDSDREVIDRALRRFARLRLGTLPLRPCEHDEALGHPLRLAELSFEACDEPAPAGALCAVIHDALLPHRAKLGDVMVALRFAIGRSLLQVNGRLEIPAEDCRAFVARALAHLESDGVDEARRRELRDLVASWLHTPVEV